MVKNYFETKSKLLVEIRFFGLIFLAFGYFCLGGCLVYVSSEDAEVVAAAIISGSNDQQVCNKASKLDGLGVLVWDNENLIWVKEAEKRQLNCFAPLTAKANARILDESKSYKGLIIKIIDVEKKERSNVLDGNISNPDYLKSVKVEGTPVKVDSEGNFTFEVYTPPEGKELTIVATDLYGFVTKTVIKVERLGRSKKRLLKFVSLNPLGRKVHKQENALALIIGIEKYKSTSAKAIYAESDARLFADFASEKLGISDKHIKTLINDEAGEREMLLSVKSWLSRAIKQNKSDVYVFFAGHGLASEDGEQMYLLPYDGAPELLDDTAITRERLFTDIASSHPRSVTVFLDTCYSGTTRGTDMLIASRPITIKALRQSIPDNFTIMTAAAGDETAKPLEEAKHGMFSYFLMKGMEGEADADQDNRITAGELHSYVQANVIQQSSGSQTPELQGEADKVLVKFQ